MGPRRDELSDLTADTRSVLVNTMAGAIPKSSPFTTETSRAKRKTAVFG
jgi:hypothetical protein